MAMLFAGINAAMGQAKPRAGCLSYEPVVVTLRGKLVRKTFPGPPNYQSIHRGDTPETAWILELSTPACVNPDPVQPDLNPALDDVRSVQLVFRGEVEVKEQHNLWGKTVIIKGTLFGAHTGHHHADAILTIVSIE